MKKTTSDSWLVRRVMKLTCFEKRLMNSPQRALQAEQTALALFEHINLPPEPRCLEIGCGQGVVTRLLAERYGARMTASDYDPDQVAMAQKRLADLEGRDEILHRRCPRDARRSNPMGIEKGDALWPESHSPCG